MGCIPGSARLVPRLCLGTHCARGSASRGRASKAVGSQAEPGNQRRQERECTPIDGDSTPESAENLKSKGAGFQWVASKLPSPQILHTLTEFFDFLAAKVCSSAAGMVTMGRTWVSWIGFMVETMLVHLPALPLSQWFQ